MIRILSHALLASSVLSSAIRKRADNVVQGRLGTDGFWNDYDGKHDSPPIELALTVEQAVSIITQCIPAMAQ